VDDEFAEMRDEPREYLVGEEMVGCNLGQPRARPGNDAPVGEHIDADFVIKAEAVCALIRSIDRENTERGRWVLPTQGLALRAAIG
jgi:hypothetical protein